MMKKLYIFTAAILITVTISAQRSYVASTLQFDAGNSEFERSSTDTIGPGALFTAPVIYTVGPMPNYGFVAGNNSYGDKQKVQVFYPTDISFVPVPYTITGALYWFGAKTVAAAPGNLKLGVYRIDGSGLVGTSTSAACPNSLIVQDNVSMGVVDTALSLLEITAHMFSTPAPQTTLNPDGYYSVGVGFDLTAINEAGGDSIGCVTSTDGDDSPANGLPVACWEQWSDDVWHSFEEDANWDLAVDMAIFPIGFNTAGVEDTYLNGVTINAVNPITTHAKFNYGVLSNVNTAVLTLVDVNGTIIFTKDLGHLNAGQYTFDYDASALAPGTYFIMFQGGRGRMAATFMKQ